VVIEASDRSKHPSLESFMADILDNQIKLRRTVVPGYYFLHYTGCGDDAGEIIFNMATTHIPTIGGQAVDYRPGKVLDSPYMQSEYGSGLILVKKGRRKLVLDFNK
jgi:hypothetical protein